MAKAIIMAGGHGERFWPVTHAKFPKYRIKLDGKASLLQTTYRRLLKIYKKNAIYVVTTRPHLKFIREELPTIDSRNILIEPFRKNTAAAIFLSCEILRKKFSEKEVVSFFPADHLIQNEAAFRKTMRAAIHLAEKKELLVTVGIKPSFPATGYGYIESGRSIPGFSQARSVKRIIEKPDRKRAAAFYQRKNFFWNAGIFTWRTGVFMKAIKKFSPAFSKNFELQRLSTSYKKLPSLSIDHALMEKASGVAVYPTRMDWCDMGNWDMFSEKLPRQGTNKNFVTGLAYPVESLNMLLLNYTEAPVIALGVKDLIVVKTALGTLICKKGRAEEAALSFKIISA